MSYYTHHMHTDAGQDDPVDAPLCHSDDLVPYDTQHKHMDGPQHIRVGVHSENSVRKRINIFVNITIIKYH